jgi:diaminopimelate decarboxylase
MAQAVAPLDDQAEPDARALLAARPHLSMHAMDGLLLEGVPLAAIADALGTPVWVYGGGTIRARARRLVGALDGLARVHYAVKANDHLAVLDRLRREGIGADIVSVGEFHRARAAGIAARDIVFSGVGKTPAELAETLSGGVGQINVESAAELDMLSSVAAGLGISAPVALRLNPDVDAGTHAKITTGRSDNKFGIAAAEIPALYARAAGLPGVRPVGLALHIGSQILSTAPFRAAYAVAAALVRTLRACGQSVTRLDCGGGLGITYGDGPEASPEAFAGALRSAFGSLDLSLMVEPGRWLVGPAGVLLASATLTKTTGGRRFVVLDAAMNDLVRPAMYDAWHGIVPLSATAARAETAPADVVGPVCESGDTFARARALPALGPGARVAILDAGAYGAVMSSTYNARPLAPIAWVEDGSWTTIRARMEPRDLWAGEVIPPPADGR